MTNTTRLGLTYPPVAGSSVADVPTDMQTFLNQLDGLAVAYSSGTFAGRPAASAIAHKVYWATDYKRSYYSDGTSWYDIQPPVGMIQAFPSITPPDATWLYCDGSSQLRATYAALFGLIGTTFGFADGTHFNVPDLRGRSIFGMDPGLARIATDPHAIASVGGLERITLAAAESGTTAHTHASGGQTGTESATHTHAPPLGNFITQYDGTHQEINYQTGGSWLTGAYGATGTESALHTHTDPATPAASAAAASTSHENMPPYMTLAWMIRT